MSQIAKYALVLCFCIIAEQIYCHVPIIVESRSPSPPPPPPAAGIIHFNPPLPVRAFSPIIAEESGVKGGIKTTRTTYVPPPPVVTQARVGVKSYVRQPLPTNQIVEHEIPGVPEPYDFNYNYNDNYGTNQHRREEGDTRGIVRGSYGYTDPNGLYRLVEYIADENGFRATIKSNEPGLVESVANPADITLAAEQSPHNVREYIRSIPRGHYESTRLRSARSTVAQSYKSGPTSPATFYNNDNPSSPLPNDY